MTTNDKLGLTTPAGREFSTKVVAAGAGKNLEAETVEMWRAASLRWGPLSPAALGCLLALVREAHGDPGLFARWRPAFLGSVPDWIVENGARSEVGDTEAAALVAALEAAPARAPIALANPPTS